MSCYVTVALDMFVYIYKFSTQKQSTVLYCMTQEAGTRLET